MFPGIRTAGEPLRTALIVHRLAHHWPIGHLSTVPIHPAVALASPVMELSRESADAASERGAYLLALLAEQGIEATAAAIEDMTEDDAKVTLLSQVTGMLAYAGRATAAPNN